MFINPRLIATVLLIVLLALILGTVSLMATTEPCYSLVPYSCWLDFAALP